MGWGICIERDEDGFVYCSDADFETHEGDYKGYPPCSYDIIYEGVESRRREIDMARDEVGIDAAREQCWEAFEYAKRRWDCLDDEDQWKVHGEWMAQKRAKLRSHLAETGPTKKELQDLVNREKDWARGR